MCEKLCRKCGVVKPLGSFYRDSKLSDGHQNYCKDCKRILDQAYRSANAERVTEKQRLWAANHPEKRAEISRIWVQNNRDRRNQHNRSWIERNEEKKRCYNLVAGAIRSGRLVADTECLICKSSGVLLEAHHQDYSKPLAVMWLCDPCHKRLHIEQRRTERTLERKSA